MLKILKSLCQTASTHSFDDAIALRNKQYRDEEIQAATGAGQWVDDAKMHPMSNIANRLYRTSGGTIHRAVFFPVCHEVDAWFFPDPQTTPQTKGA